MNPPYGERISTPDLLGTYRMIGERLKHEFGGNEAWILSYREECFEQIGLKPSIKIPVYNGSLECEFRKYTLFDGKMKTFRQEGGVVKTEQEKREMAQKHRFKKTASSRSDSSRKKPTRKATSAHSRSIRSRTRTGRISHARTSTTITTTSTTRRATAATRKTATITRDAASTKAVTTSSGRDSKAAKDKVMATAATSSRVTVASRTRINPSERRSPVLPSLTHKAMAHLTHCTSYQL